MFGIKQGWACLFGGLMLVLLLGTHLLYPDDAPLARYDFLVIGAVAIQAAMLLLKLESWDEARVILVFHVVGTIMELFKTAAGIVDLSRAQPAADRRGAAVLGLHVCGGGQLHRAHLAHLRHPLHGLSAAVDHLAAGGGDLCELLRPSLGDGHALGPVRGDGAAVPGAGGSISRRTGRGAGCRCCSGFFLVALFIWFAENLGTFSRAWIYPDQADGWAPVSMAKMGSWYLLMIISFVLVSLVRRPEAEAPMTRI